MGYCNYINRTCSFSENCKKNLYVNLDKQSKLLDIYSEDELTVIQYIIGIRKIMKFEGAQKEITYEDRGKVEQTLAKKIDNYSLGYSSIGLNKDGYGFFLAGRNELDLRRFLHSNYSSEIKHKIVKVGIMMGYPICCIKNYIKFVDKYGYTSELDEKFEEQVIDNTSLCPLLGTQKKLFVHFPCSKKCEATLMNSESVLDWILFVDKKISITDFF